MNPIKNIIVSSIVPIGIFVVLTIALILGLYFLLFKKPQVVVKGGESVITQLRTLSRYETASFTIEKIIEAGSEGNRYQELLFGDRILLVANGEVIAGFDFSELSEQDITLSEDSVTLNLPPPQILSARLDSQKTRVYDRRQGFLTHGDKDLESLARGEAEKSIRLAACEGKILEMAGKNAVSQMSALIKSLGYTTVVVNVPSGIC